MATRAPMVLLLALVAAQGAIGQTPAPMYMPRNFELVDQNGVTLAGPIYDGANAGNIRIPEPAISVGDPESGGLTWQRLRARVQPILGVPVGTNNDESQLRQHNLLGLMSWTPWNNPFEPIPTTTFSLGEDSETFTFVGSTGGAPREPNGSGASCQDQSNSVCTHYRSDGSVATYQAAAIWNADGSINFYGGRITSLSKPNGEVLTWHYYTVPSGGYQGRWRLQSVTNNLGYQIHFQYESNTATDGTSAWRFWRIQKVTAIDNSLNPCAPTAFSCSDSIGGNWPYLVYGLSGTTTSTVTDRLGNVHKFHFSGNLQTLTPTEVVLTGYSSPASSSLDISLQYSPLRVTNAKGTWTYSFSDPGGNTQISGPAGYSQTIQFLALYPNFGSATPAPVPLSVTTNGQTTTYDYYLNYDSLGQTIPPLKLRRVTEPDGNYEEYEYDSRRNVTHVRRAGKPGSGLPDSHLYASYEEPIAVVCTNKATCNKPVWTRDEFGAQTDYTYDAGHGGVLTVTAPAPGSGPTPTVRPQTRYTYSANGTSVQRVASVKSCATAATCAGGASETVVETTYNAKRMPSTVTTRAGDSSVVSTVTMTYTPQGDVATMDGPLSGTGDTTYLYYDAMRQLRATVSPPANDGALYGVVRTTYDADGNPTLIESGTATSPANWNSLSVITRTAMVYDTYGRKEREVSVNPGTGASEAVTQYSYDAAGRVQCVTQRMNPANFPSLPGACTLTTEGAFGPDQITRTTYTANGDVSLIQTGYLTPLQRNERTFTYLNHGQVGTVKDARNNLTTYEYDGFNRLKKTRYPVTTAGSNSSSTTDFEELSYDAAGQVLTERRRDGQIITNAWDALGRLRTIDRPGSEPTITNAYDNLDRLISSADGAITLSWTYDALGRMLTEAQPLGTVSNQYDAAGQRTRLTYPGSGLYLQYDWYKDGQLKAIRENGATSGAGVLATYAYDGVARRASVTRGNGAVTTYAHDSLSRLTSMGHNLITGGATYDQSWTYAWTPASQLSTRSMGKSYYEWPSASAFTDNYVADGLNRYSSAAGLSLGYDARGNTTNDGTKTYTYDSSNRLVSSPTNGAAAVYDPSGRLYQISQGGATTRFLYDGVRVIGEYNGSSTLLRRHVHGAGVDEAIAWYNGAGTTQRRHIFADERGSVIAEDTGSVLNTRRYDEYGNADGPYAGRFQYTGQMWLGELGLNHYKARAYSPKLGRFLQTDPIGYQDQMNLYAYVGNDPLGRTDPTGLKCVEAGDSDYVCTVDFVDDARVEYDKNGKAIIPEGAKGATLDAYKAIDKFNQAMTKAANELANNPDRNTTIGSREVTSSDVIQRLKLGSGDYFSTTPAVRFDIEKNRNDFDHGVAAESLRGGSGAVYYPSGFSSSRELQEILFVHEKIHAIPWLRYYLFDQGSRAHNEEYNAAARALLGR